MEQAPHNTQAKPDTTHNDASNQPTLTKNKPYLTERILHWVSALLILYMLMNMSSMIHIADYTQAGTEAHREQVVSSHASVGAVLVVLLMIRILWSHIFRKHVERLSIDKPIHRYLVKGTHVLLYSALFLLPLTGVMMILNSEMTISILGTEVMGNSGYHSKGYGKFHDMHLNLITATWWLIFIHFVGVMAARK